MPDPLPKKEVPRQKGGGYTPSSVKKTVAGPLVFPLFFATGQRVLPCRSNLMGTCPPPPRNIASKFCPGNSGKLLSRGTPPFQKKLKPAIPQNRTSSLKKNLCPTPGEIASSGNCQRIFPTPTGEFRSCPERVGYFL